MPRSGQVWFPVTEHRGTGSGTATGIFTADVEFSFWLEEYDDYDDEDDDDDADVEDDDDLRLVDEEDDDDWKLLGPQNTKFPNQIENFLGPKILSTVDPTLKRKSVSGKSLKIYLLFTNTWYPIFVW